MKILVISSSLRKKNTYIALKRIENVHKELFPAEYEYLFLKDADLKTCLGCHLCLTAGEQHCPLKDDRDSIVSRIESADAVILASPNHTMNVNWLMKNYIDRFSYLLHRPRYFDQRFMILITSGSYPGVTSAIKALSPIASGGKVISRIGIMNSPGMHDAKIRKEEVKLTRGARKFALAMQKKHEFKTSVANMLWFAVFKAMTKEHAADFPADEEYYRDKSFFVDTRLNVFQKGTIGLFTGLFQFFVRRGVV